MYLSYYDLIIKPFQINTDPRFLWMGEKHKEALSILKYGILDSRGFLLLTGDVGTGKTTLINALIRSLGDQIVVATVPDPGLEQLEFFNYVAQVFGMKQAFQTKGSFLVSFRNFLYDAYADGKKVLLIVDEAQRLNPDLLEEIRLLSNIEKEDQKLLNIFFVGQIEFNNFLLEPRNRALRQRITLNFNIDPLSQSETRQYIEHRLLIAGSTRKIFSPDAFQEIYNFSRGYPRLINIICDHALLTGFVEENEKIKLKTIKECARELSIPSADRKFVEGRKKEFDRGNHTSSFKFSNLSFKRISAYSLTLFLLAFISLLFLWPERMNSYFSVLTRLFGHDPAVRSPLNADNKLPKAANGKKNPITFQKVLPPSTGGLSTEDVSTGSASTNQAALSKKAPDPTSRQGSLKRAIRGGSRETGEDSNPKPFDTSRDLIRNQKFVVYYDFNSNDLSKEATQMLDGLAKKIIANPTLKIDVKGYTDASGNYTYNQKLSEFRANIVKSYLMAKGVEAANITTVGLGPGNPAGGGNIKQDSKASRRVEIELHF